MGDAHEAGDLAPRGPWLVALALLASWALVTWRSGPPAPLGGDAPQELFSAERAFGALERLLGDGAPHPSGSGAGAAVRARLEGELEALGLTPVPHETLVQQDNRIAVVRNVLARIPGREPGPAHQGVLLVAHHDSVGAGPGAADDGSGVATLLETARALLAGPQARRDVMLLFSDGEEDGLFGARAFCRGHPWRERVGVVLNFEARGTGGPSMLFQTSGPNRWLIDAAREALPRPWTSSVADLVYNTMPNDTDLTPFIGAGVAGINFAFIDGLARYHTPLDDLAHLDRGSLQHHGDNALALTRAFAQRDLDAPRGELPSGAPAGAAVFFDLLELGIVSWPRGWSLPLALAVLAAGGAALARDVRRRTSPGAVLRGILAALLALVLAVLLGSAGPFLVKLARGLEFPALAHPWTLALATWGGVLLALCWAPRPETPGHGSFYAVWLLYALAALAAAWLEPAVGYLFLIPAAVSAAGVLLLPARLAQVEALTILVAGLLWIPIVYGLRLGFGFALPPLVAAPIALLALWLLPALRRSARKASAPLQRAALAAALIGTLSGWWLPAHTAENPGWLSLHYEASVSGSAAIRADDEWAAPTAAMRALAGLGYANEGECYLVNPAPPWEVPAPAVELLEEGSASLHDGRGYRIRLASPLGATRLFLRLSAQARLLGAAWPPGSEDSVVDGGPGTDWVFSGVGPEGIEVEIIENYNGWLRGEAQVPPRFHLAEETAALPPSMAPFLQARPAELVPRGRGDTSTVWTRVQL